MTVGKVVAILGLCAMLCLGIGIFVDNANAQNDSGAAKRVDKGIANKRGVAASLKTVKKGDEAPKRATPVQMAIGVGSCFVAFIVVKWL